MSHEGFVINKARTLHTIITTTPFLSATCGINCNNTLHLRIDAKLRQRAY